MNVSQGHSGAQRHGSESHRTSNSNHGQGSQSSNNQIDDLLSTIDQGLSGGTDPAQAFQNVISKLRNSGNPKLNAIADQLENLKGRPMADTGNPAISNLDAARQMISGLKNNGGSDNAGNGGQTGNAGHASHGNHGSNGSNGSSSHGTRSCTQSRQAIAY